MPSYGEFSEVAVCNLALQAIGRGARIVTLDEDTEAARACQLRYPYVRDAVLRAYDWNFAAARKELAKNATAPAFEFANAYDLPPDCLLVREVWQGNAEDWRIEGRQILTDMGDPIYIKYTRRVVEVPLFDPLFTEAVAQRLGSDICVQLTESVSRAQGLWEVYMAKLIEARRRDAQEGQPDSPPRDTWLDSREHGTARGYRDWKGE